jgi:hypothetical protein
MGFHGVTMINIIVCRYDHNNLMENDRKNLSFELVHQGLACLITNNMHY